MRPDEAGGGRRQVLQLATSKNDPLAEVVFDQRESGNPNCGCRLPPIDVVAFAKACGADGFHGEHPEEICPALQTTSSSPSPALVEAVVDPRKNRRSPTN